MLLSEKIKKEIQDFGFPSIDSMMELQRISELSKQIKEKYNIEYFAINTEEKNYLVLYCMEVEGIALDCVNVIESLK